MVFTQEQKKQFRSIGHYLRPILIVAEDGSTEGVPAELECALSDHELIKVKPALAKRDDRHALLDELCAQSRNDLARGISKMVLVCRENPKPNKNLSNISRFTSIRYPIQPRLGNPLTWFRRLPRPAPVPATTPATGHTLPPPGS